MLGAISGLNKISPLCRRPEEPDAENSPDVMLYYNDDEKEIALSDSSLSVEVEVVQVIDDVVYTQRTIEDRVSNPHGEHAEDVWIIRRAMLEQLLPRVSIPTVEPSHL
jgi:hypothetical protein